MSDIVERLPMIIPSRAQVENAVRAMERMHHGMGYRKTPRDLEQMMWAALFAIWSEWQAGTGEGR